MKELGIIVYGKRKIWSLLLNSFYQKNMIVTCTNGHVSYSRIFSSFLLRNSVYFFHHAYSLFQEENKKVDYSLYIGGLNKPNLIANENSEIQFYGKNGFERERVICSGFVGYKKEWIDKLLNAILKTTKHKNKISNEKYKKKIFVPIRGPHKFFLTQENYDYQLECISKVAKKFNNYLFIVKPHPRQKNLDKLEKLFKYDENIIFEHYNTMYLANKSDLVIAFWSSAIMDALAVEKPVIEFHIHKEYHPELVLNDNKLESLYVSTKLCKNISKYECLENFLLKTSQWQSEYIKSREIFDKTFIVNENFLNQSESILEKDFKITISKTIQIVLNLISFFTKKLFR